MAVTTATRPQEKTGQWSSIFPPEQVSAQQSALFVKKLLAVAVSTITYLRTIFPEHAFGDRCLEDLNLKVLRDDSACPGACQVIKWMKGCFEALDKKYLRALIIGIYVDPENPGTVIESYTFKFSYIGEEPSIDVYRNDKKIAGAKTEAETRKATLHLLRTIVVLTQSLKLLPDDVMMTMKLLYYDDVTPADYEPPGFQSAKRDSFDFLEEPMNIKIGDVATPFHMLKLRMKTDRSQFELKDDDEVAEDDEENTIKDDQDKDKEMRDVSDEIAVDRSEAEPNTSADVPTENPRIPEKHEEAVVGSQSESVVDEETVVHCPCGVNEDDGLMIRCEFCKTWQHALCFKIQTEEEAPAKHVCNECVQMDDPLKQPTDPYLSTLNATDVQATCLWRRALHAAQETTRILVPNFARRLGVEMNVSRGLVNRLEKAGYCKNASKGKRLGKVVNIAKLTSEGIPKYFQKDQKETEKMESDKHPSDLDHLTKKASELHVSGHQVDSNILEEKRGTSKESDEVCLPVKSKSKRGRKRAVTVDDNEFEVSNSQDADHVTRGKRRRKASMVNKPVMV